MEIAKAPSSKSVMTVNRTIIIATLCVLLLGATQSNASLAGFNWAILPDPAGDCFGVNPQHDVNFLNTSKDASSLTLIISFIDPISPPYGGANQVSGFIDLDTDQNNATGAASHLLAYPQCLNPILGVEYYIDLSSY